MQKDVRVSNAAPICVETPTYENTFNRFQTIKKSSKSPTGTSKARLGSGFGGRWGRSELTRLRILPS